MAADARSTRILIVDDSAVMRSLLRSVVSAESGLEVVGTAADGASALSSLGAFNPDLILLDVEMPVMDGLVTLRELRRRGYTMPVIVCSALTQHGAKVTLEALACGASDYVAKPAGQANRESAIKTLAQELGPKIAALTQQHKAGVPAPHAATIVQGLPRAAIAASRRARPAGAGPRVLVIGVSTGGPAALEQLMPLLPTDFPLPVLIVQHMPELFTKVFAERLEHRAHLRVCEGTEGDAVAAGTVYVARGNWHMEILAARTTALPTLHLSQGPLENHCRPAVDVLFRSAAAVYGAGVLAVVLTGMGSDGLQGCRVIRDAGGTVLVQDQASSTVWGMPGVVANAGLANKVLPLDQMAAEIVRLAGRREHEARELRKPAVL